MQENIKYKDIHIYHRRNSAKEKAMFFCVCFYQFCGHKKAFMAKLAKKLIKIVDDNKTLVSSKYKKDTLPVSLEKYFSTVLKVNPRLSQGYPHK